MLLPKVPHISFPDILVLGDPIIDIYSKNAYPGGALNTYYNLKYLTKKVKYYFPFENYIKYFHPNYVSIYNYYTSLKYSFTAKTIVCSDYNKGFLQNTKSKLYCDLIIVDSKYNSLDMSLLSKAKVKILKHTSTDIINLNFFSNFDYIILTNHSKNICCYNNKYQLLYTKKPININCLNTSGAGDVFTAVLAYALHNSFDKQNLSVLFEAIDKAAFYSSLSTLTPFTSNLKDLHVHY
jgi:hypothetical protein